MKTLIAIAACLFMCMTCQGEGKERIIWQRSAGIDIGSAVNEGAMKFMISQQFSPHWSIDASHTTRIRMIRKKLDPEFEEHYSELGYTQNKDTDPTYEMATADLTLSYWLKEYYRGLFFQAGCRTGITMRAEGIVGLGYCIRIWKGLTCSLSFDTTLGTDRQNHLGLTICYVMK